MLKNSHLFCFGMGYCATTLTKQLSQDDWMVSGTSQSESLEKTIHTFSGNAPMETASDVLAGITHILISIPPSDNHDPVLAWHKKDIIKLKSLQWLDIYQQQEFMVTPMGKWLMRPPQRIPHRCEAKIA